MKTEVRKKAPSLDVEFFRMETTDFVNIVRKCSSGANSTILVIGDRSLPEIVTLENIQEIETHSSLIKVPFKLKIDTTELFVSFDSAYLTGYGEDSTVARSLAHEIKQFRPWFRFIYQKYTEFVFGLTLLIIYLIVDGFSKIDLLPSVFLILIPSAIFMAAIQIRLRKNMIFFRPRGNFWGRNRDPIIMTILSPIILGLAFYFWEAAKELFFSNTDNSTPIQSTPQNER